MKKPLIIIKNAMSVDMIERIKARVKAQQRPKLAKPKFSKWEVERILTLLDFED